MSGFPSTLTVVATLWLLVIVLFLVLVFAGPVVAHLREKRREKRRERRWLAEQTEPVQDPKFLPMKEPAAPGHTAYVSTMTYPGDEHVDLLPGYQVIHIVKPGQRPVDVWLDDES